MKIWGHIRNKKVRIHLLVWSCFILYESLIVQFTRHQLPPIGDFLVYYSINILLFYFNAHILLEQTLKFKKIGVWLLPIGIVLEIVVYLAILMVSVNIASNYLGIEIGQVNFNDRFYFGKTLWRGLYFIGFSTGYYYLITYLRERERTVALEKQRLHQIIEQQKMEKELAKAQNSYLRAQINPHFLFNTLNFIYNRTRKSAPIAADAILTLSAMMRYAVESNEEKGYIYISEEIEQVHHLIHLHKLRLGESLFFQIDVDAEATHIRIIPLILITLTENIFKHGNLSRSDHPAILRIYIQYGTLFIETENLINDIHNKTGLNKGMENISKRLQHSYGSQAEFSYYEDHIRHFMTKVSIKLEAVNAFAPLKASSESIDK